MDFSYLKELDVKDKTARYPLYQIGNEPTLILYPANESNKKYFNAVLKKSRSNVRAIQAGHVNQSMISESRNKDRELYPLYVIAGWEGVVDAEGNEVPFSPDACKDFLNALPDWIFDELRNFASKSSNFAETRVDPGEIAGN